MEYRKHFYITLFSNASQKTSRKYARRVNNSVGTTHRPGFDSWEVGLCEFSCSPSVIGTVDVIVTTDSLVYCDLITPHFVVGQYSRYLRAFIYEPEYCDHAFNNVYYMPVENAPSRI
jgi:hypothetical protein